MTSLSYRGHRFPASIIQHAIMCPALNPEFRRALEETREMQVAV
jgi:hypothetical protein